MVVPKADETILHGAIVLAASKFQTEPTSGTAKDPALFLLGSGVLARFQNAWTRGIPANTVGDRKEVAPLQTIYGEDMVLQGFVEYMALELSTPLYGMPLEDTRKKLEEIYAPLSDGYSERELLADLAALVNMPVVRGGLHAYILKRSREITQLDGVDPPAVRQNRVIEKFAAWFRENAAGNFNYDTDFLQYVLNCFDNDYYPGNTQEVIDLLVNDSSGGLGRMNLT